MGQTYLPEEEAKSFIEALCGLTVTKIQETSDKSADYTVDGDYPPYLVEVKSRNLDERIENPPLAKGPPVVRSSTWDPKVRQWLINARQQFASVDPMHDRLWFLWFSAESPVDAESQIERIKSSLYGVRRAIEAVKPHRQFRCYYAADAMFEAVPQIDAAIVYRATGSECYLGVCPNEASPRISQVLASKLIRAFRSNGLTQMLPSEREGATVLSRSLQAEPEAVRLRHAQKVTGVPRLTFWAKEIEYMDAMKVPLEPSD